MVVVVVVLIDDADAEGLAVAELAVVHALDIEVRHGLKVAGFQ